MTTHCYCLLSQITAITTPVSRQRLDMLIMVSILGVHVLLSTAISAKSRHVKITSFTRIMLPESRLVLKKNNFPHCVSIFSKIINN